MPVREMGECRPYLQHYGRLARNNYRELTTSSGAVPAEIFPTTSQEKEERESETEADLLGRPPQLPTSQAHRILSGESPARIFAEQDEDDVDWVGASFTLNKDNKAELHALLANFEAYGSLRPGQPSCRTILNCHH